MVTTGEISGTQAIDFHSTGHDFFPAGSPQRAWLDEYQRGVTAYVARSRLVSGFKAYFFVDMIVLPIYVLQAYPNATSDGSHILWNPTTQYLVEVMINETFAMFPNVSGFVVRTGETYTYDTPYHVGNSPSNGTNARWTEFVTFLRLTVCQRLGKELFFRSWDNWASSAATYHKITDPIPPHPLLYFSIKHSPGDFTRPAGWNPTLGVGNHAQVIIIAKQTKNYQAR